MPVKVPLQGRLEKNLISVAVEQGTLRLYNGFLDKKGSITKRPGLLLNQSIIASEKVQGLYYWQAKDKIVAVVGGDIYAADSLTETLVKVNTTGDSLELGIVKIVDTGYWLYFCSAGGGKMMIWNGSDPATFVTDGAAPASVTTITTLNKRVIANDGDTNKIWYTAPASLTTPTAELTWEGYIEYGRINESIIGLDVSGGELIAFKRDSMQAYFDDGKTPYKPLTGSQQKYGLINPSATGAFQNALYFVSPDTTIYKLENRQVSDISSEFMGQELNKLLNVNTASIFELDKKVIFNFPDEDKTYAYDPLLRTWSNLTSFDGGLDKSFLATSATVIRAAGSTNLWVIGAKDGSLYFWDPSVYTDAGTPIRFVVRTGHIGYNTLNRKASTRLVVKVSTEAFRESTMPEISFPHAQRCKLYNYTVTMPSGTSATITGLPTGFTASFVAPVLTISGSTENYVGESPVQVTIIDSRGAKYIYTDTFVVDDTDELEIGVL